MSEKKEIWFEVHRLYLTDNGPKKSDVKMIEISDDDTNEEIKIKMTSAFRLEDLGLHIVLKLRNERGSLIPINTRLEINSQQSPYLLEVVRRYQSTSPSTKSIMFECYNETMKLKLIDIINRIEKLESVCPELKLRKEEKIHDELKDIDRKLNFFSKRIAEADDANWAGMFRKNPLW